ncbi:MAG: hypothetical protein P1P87_13400, partial [Trueperaceae bacterium]|nr:hypothetical protein [Trueperaceae bacterium]
MDEHVRQRTTLHHPRGEQETAGREARDRAVGGADADAEVVNPGGNYSVRGGTLAQKIYNPDTPTKDRLKNP